MPGPAAAARTPPTPLRSCRRGNGRSGGCGRSRPGSTGTPPRRGRQLAGHHDRRQGRTARGLLASRWIRHPSDYQGPPSFTPATRRALPGNVRYLPPGQAGSQAGSYAKRITVLAAYAAANTDTFLGERFRRLASRPGGGGRKKAGCAVGRSILIIVWHLLNDPAARYRDLGPDWHARHTDRSRKARNAQRQLKALGYDVIITLREDAA